MDSFVSILIWLGSGFALSVGFISGVIVMGMFFKKKTASDQIAERVNDLLEQRNKIGESQVEALHRIADVIKNK